MSVEEFPVEEYLLHHTGGLLRCCRCVHEVLQGDGCRPGLVLERNLGQAVCAPPALVSGALVVQVGTNLALAARQQPE